MGRSATLRSRRMASGLTQQALATRAGISRQAYAAIESRGARPSVDVAMRIARALETTVEELFEVSAPEAGTVSADLVGARPSREAFPVRLAEIGRRLLAFSTHRMGGAGLTSADGLARPDVGDRVRVDRFVGVRPTPDLVVLGCDPAFALVVETLRRDRGLDVLWVQAGSRAALEALARGEAHVAGVHLFDPETARYNAPWVERLVPGACTRVRFAVWEETLLMAPGNPLGVRGVADLARPDLRFVNREPGSGSRALIDASLRESGVPASAITGFDTTVARSHLEVAAAIAAGTADAGIGIKAAGLSYDLSAIVLATEPYDLVVPDALLDLPAVQALLEVLRSPALRLQVSALGGYDVSSMGQPA